MITRNKQFKVLLKGSTYYMHDNETLDGVNIPDGVHIVVANNCTLRNIVCRSTQLVISSCSRLAIEDSIIKIIPGYPLKILDLLDKAFKFSCLTIQHEKKVLLHGDIVVFYFDGLPKVTVLPPKDAIEVDLNMKANWN